MHAGRNPTNAMLCLSQCIISGGTWGQWDPQLVVFTSITCSWWYLPDFSTIKVLFVSLKLIFCRETLRYEDSVSLFKLSPTSSGICWQFLLKIIITMVLVTWRYSKSIISSICISWHSTSKKRFSFFLIHSFIHSISMDSWILIYSMGYNPFLSLFVLILKLSLI